jgi:hypothetical protein
VDRIDLAEVFADQVRLTHFDGHSVRIEFAVSRPHMVNETQAETTVYPAARLAISPMAAASLNQQLSTLLVILEQQGVLKRLAPSSATKQ